MDKMKEFIPELPEEVLRACVDGLLGEIYPNIRAISAGLTRDNVFILHYYLDREPTDYDRDSIDAVVNEILIYLPTEGVIEKVSTHVFYENGSYENMSRMSGFLYARRQYK
ncbi:hypothetical protein [Entomobacter blattae]|uniref:Uncharacterized protein n=1 Tax=Entomobacter blattae TaxID=2762277 RepID=A0A7H1NNN1_9PROT|nr:hypothetical protein [Entomobacter blattae]QNT77391.1 hypothetical protein JGUZn3_01250 [Entomobacter blattae]